MVAKSPRGPPPVRRNGKASGADSGAGGRADFAALRLCPHRVQVRGGPHPCGAVLSLSLDSRSGFVKLSTVSLSLGLLIHKMGQIVMHGLPFSWTVVQIKRANAT